MSSDCSSQYLASLFGLHGKTALITGGTRGIGRGLSLALASAGANIILLARRPSDETVTSTVAAIQALGRQCLVYNCDLANRSHVLSVVSRVSKTDGHEVDIIVHSGGVQHRSPAEDFPTEKWDDILSVNLTAGFLLSREYAKHWLETSLKQTHPPLVDDSLLAGKRKKIIFIASVTIYAGSLQIPAYVATKGALGSLTRALNNEWMGKGINVNAVAPGYIETELTKGIRDDGERERTILDRVPANRWGTAEDLAGSVVHLASRGSDFVGGEVYMVDGGFNAR